MSRKATSKDFYFGERVMAPFVEQKSITIVIIYQRPNKTTQVIVKQHNDSLKHTHIHKEFLIAIIIMHFQIIRLETARWQKYKSEGVSSHQTGKTDSTESRRIESKMGNAFSLIRLPKVKKVILCHKDMEKQAPPHTVDKSLWIETWKCQNYRNMGT